MNLGAFSGFCRWNLMQIMFNSISQILPKCWINIINLFSCRRRVIQITDGVDDMGEMVWPLLGMLVLSWVLTYLAIWKGVKVTGKIMYFTGIYPVPCCPRSPIS